MTSEQSKKWVRKPETYPGWQDVPIKDGEWSTLMHIIKEHLKEMDYIMVQHMSWSRTSKNKRRDRLICLQGGCKHHKTKERGRGR